MRHLVVLLALTACKASLGSQDAGSSDATPDAPVDVIMVKPWSAPTPIGITPVGDDDPTATSDLLELYFNRSGDIYVTKRASVADPWGTPTAVAEVNTTSTETTPEVSYDGLTLYFASSRADTGTLGSFDIWLSTRTSRSSTWGTPMHIDELSSSSSEGSPASTDPLVIVIDSNRSGSALVDIYLAQRTSATAAWGTPVRVLELASAEDDSNPMLTSDALAMYFDSSRGGDRDLYVATRPSATASFNGPQRITELVSTAADTDAWISPDGRTLYFTSDRDGTLRLWQTTR